MNFMKMLRTAGMVASAAVLISAPGCGGGSSGEYTALLLAGPFLSTVTQDSATITWQTDKKEQAVLDYGSTESYGKQASGQSEKVTLGAGDFYLNTVSIGGLEPATWTHYRIVSLGQPSQDFSFRTAPAPGGDFRFMVYGDSRPAWPVILETPDDSVHQAILAKMRERSPDFVINTGDLVYDGYDPAEWNHLFSVLGSFPSTVPFLPVLGNHDRGGEEVISVSFGTPMNVYYSFDYGNTHFTVINTYLDFSPQSTQYQWLVKDLTEAKAREGITRLLAFMHAPAYCSAPDPHLDDMGNPNALQGEDAREYLAPVFTGQGVKMVFQGHVHIYERTKAINGVVYIVSGGGGSPLSDDGVLNAEPWTAYKEGSNHFVEMTVESNYMNLKAKYKDGTAFDTENFN